MSCAKTTDDSSAGTDTSVTAAMGQLTDIPLTRRSRAARLIEQLLATGDITPAQLAAAIVVNDGTLESYRSGHTKIPLERQLCIGLVAIEQPGMRRAGLSLRSQVEAEMGLESTRSETHNGPPVSHRWR